MKNLYRYIEERFKQEWDNVLEMANIGYPSFDRTLYNISVHGLNAGERKGPHFHIYLEDDVRPFSKFNIEIALDELFCYDELNILRLKDAKSHKDITNRTNCSWKGYTKIKNELENWLFDKSEKPGNFKDNLDALIYFYNSESGPSNQNYLLRYIQEKGMKILNKYKDYFSKEDQIKYKNCFYER